MTINLILKKISHKKNWTESKKKHLKNEDEASKSDTNVTLNHMTFILIIYSN